MSSIPTAKPIVVRKKLVKPLLKRDKLPISNYEHDFIKRLEREKILVVEASTGSGKSTQLPQYVAKSDLFQAERRKAIAEIKYGGSKSPLGMPSQGKMVVSTQPNAFAAAAVATRVGYEYDDDHLGRKVGLITPTETKFDPTQCEILFVSDSELVRIMTQDKLLSRVGVLIIDEAHERTLYTDVIMTLAKEIREQRDDFYIVISSATIEVKRFLSFMFNLDDSFGGSAASQAFIQSKSTLGFRPTPLTVQGKTYEVAISYDPMEVRDPTQEKDPYLSQILTPKLAQVLRKYLNPQIKGHALVFVEDTHTVLRVVHHLRRYLRLQTKLVLENGLDPVTTKKFLTSENTRVIPLYLSMPLKEQQKIMDFVRSFQGNQDIRYVFVADNVAETSITLPDVKLVIDTGRMMVSTYDMMRRLMVTEETFVSKDRAAQRQGRTGRTSPGLCVRLYNETDLKLDRVEPDIKRVALDKVALQLAAMNINPKALRLIEPPEDHKFVFAIEQLIQYQCLVSNAQHDFAAHLEITDKGRVFVQLPFAPDTCEQLWQASLISAEATTIMHCISCLFNNESSNIFEHSAGLTWKALAEQIIDERPFDISGQVGFENNLLASQHWTPQQHQLQIQQQAALSSASSPRGGNSTPKTPQKDVIVPVSNFNPLQENPNPLIIEHNTTMTDYVIDKSRGKQPHLWYNPFWQTTPNLKFGFNLNSGSDLELGYLMYLMLMHYRKPGCGLCIKRSGGTAPTLDDIAKAEEATMNDDDEAQFSAIRSNNNNRLDDLGLDDGDNEELSAATAGNNNNSFKRCELCSECERDFCDIYKVLPTAIKQAENFIRSTRDLVHRSLCRNYSIQSGQRDDKKNVDRVKNITAIASSQYRPHPADYSPTRIITHCIYTALSHMAGVVLVTDHLAEGVVLPHKYFKMVKATIDPNACSNTVDTYYKLVSVPQNKVKKTRYTCVKHFIVVHVTARKAHDYNITCLHPFDLDELLPLAQEVFRQNILSLQLQRVTQHAHIGRGLYSSIDYVLSNQRIDNMARQYDLEKSHLRQQALAAQGTIAYRTDDGETTRNMEAMNWSRFAAIPFDKGTMAVHTLVRYQEETVRRIEEIIFTASRHMQHLYERERRSYRLPLSNTMHVDITLSHDFSLKEIIVHANGKMFSVRPDSLRRQANAGNTAAAAAAAAVFQRTQGVTLGSKSQQMNQIGLTKPPLLQQHSSAEDKLAREFGSNQGVAAIATDVRDIEQHWREQQEQQFNDDAYAAALDDNDEDDDIEMLDDDIIMLPNDTAGPAQLAKTGSSDVTHHLQQPILLQQRSLDRLPSGQGISFTYSQSTDRQKNEINLAQKYDPLQITRFPSSLWHKHDAKKNYTNTLSLRRRIDINQHTTLAKLCTVYDIENNVRAASNHQEEDLLRTVSPLRDVYDAIHRCFEDIIQSLHVLHKYQYFPLIPEFSEYSQTVSHIYDQSTALLKFTNNTDVSSGLRSILENFASFDEQQGDYFIASLLDIQQCFNAILLFIEKQIRSKNYTKPHELAKELLSILSFNFSIFVSIHFELGPRDLISWIQLAPRAGDLFNLDIDPVVPNKPATGLRRFIAPSKDRFRILSEPIYDKTNPNIDVRETLLSNGYLIDPADLRLLQVSENEISSIFSSVLQIQGFDCLYTISASVDHSEILNVTDALNQIKSTLIQLYGKEQYQLEILERTDIVVNDYADEPTLKPHTRTQITFSGNQATVYQSVRTLLKISEPQSIPVGPLTNSTNALLQFMVEMKTFGPFVARHGVAAEYIRHGSDGTIALWGTAQNVHALDLELKRYVSLFEKRRQAFPLPHNIFADLKNDNENSPFYSAYQLLTQQIDKISNKTAKYMLKTDESAFVLETHTPEELTRCLVAIRGFKSKCGIEDDTKQVPCFVCLQNVPGSVQRLSTCDHAICSTCLATHTEHIINHVRGQLAQRELDREEARLEQAERAGGIGVDDDTVGRIAGKNVKDEHYVTGQADEQIKLQQELKLSYDIQCPCYQSRRFDGPDYYVKIASLGGVKRAKPSSAEMIGGKGCEFAVLPADIIRICTPSQIHNILFLLAKPVMKATNAYLPCPSASCNTLLSLLPYYQQCPRCNVGTCTQCNVTNSSLHEMVPCHIFKGILSYHDEVQLLFNADLDKLLKMVVAGKKDAGDLSKMTTKSNLLLRPYLTQEIQTRLALATLLIQQTQKFLNDDWLKHSLHNHNLVKSIPQIFFNPGIFSQCGSYIRFLRGCKDKLSQIPAYYNIFSRGRNIPLEYDTKTQYALFNELFVRSGAKFAYHGTPRAENVPLIMHHGLDPKFRAGQAYGPGEYLGVSPSVSYDYGREFFLLVLFLDGLDLYSLHPGFCYVIKNPIDFKSAYCLPVGVVRVSDVKTRLPVPAYEHNLTLDVHGVKTSTAAWLKHLGLDTSASLVKALYKDEKLDSIHGCEKPPGTYFADLAKFTELRKAYHADPKIYLGDSYQTK